MTTHKATKNRHGEYEYRGFTIAQAHNDRQWHIMLGGVKGWLASARTLSAAKLRIDRWFEIRASGEQMSQKFVDAIDFVVRKQCAQGWGDDGPSVSCPDQQLCRHGVEA